MLCVVTAVAYTIPESRQAAPWVTCANGEGSSRARFAADLYDKTLAARCDSMGLSCPNGGSTCKGASPAARCVVCR
jgi:hypothetical protein